MTDDTKSELQSTDFIEISENVELREFELDLNNGRIVSTIRTEFLSGACDLLAATYGKKTMNTELDLVRERRAFAKCFGREPVLFERDDGDSLFLIGKVRADLTPRNLVELKRPYWLWAQRSDEELPTELNPIVFNLDGTLALQLESMFAYLDSCARVWQWSSKPILQLFKKKQR